MCRKLFVLLFVIAVNARPENLQQNVEPNEASAAAAQELQALAQPETQALLENQDLLDFLEAESEVQAQSQPEVLNRKKKQVTTFCVEIRPSDHKPPFQVCPYQQGLYNYKTEHDQSGSDKIKIDHSEQSGAQFQSKPAPIKTYESKHPYGTFESNFPSVQNVGPARAAMEDPEMHHEQMNPSTGAAKSEKNIVVQPPPLPPTPDDVPQPQNPVKTPENIKPTTENEDVPKEDELPSKGAANVAQQTAVRSAFVDDSNNAESPNKGLEKEDKEEPKEDTGRASKLEDTLKEAPKMRAPEPSNNGHQQYIPVSPVRYPQHHSGLVITCQPNLAGYAHGIPQSYHQPNYNYRAASPTFDMRPHQYKNYGNYGNYGYGNGYNPQAHMYHGPVYPYPMHHPHKPQIHKMDPHYKHKPAEYYPYGPVYPHPYNEHHSTHHTSEHHKESDEEVHNNFGEMDERTAEGSMDERTKEQHTLQKMEDISNQRLSASWVPDGMEEVFVVGSPKEEGGWRNAEPEHKETQNNEHLSPNHENYLPTGPAARESDANPIQTNPNPKEDETKLPGGVGEDGWKNGHNGEYLPPAVPPKEDIPVHPGPMPTHPGAREADYPLNPEHAAPKSENLEDGGWRNADPVGMNFNGGFNENKSFENKVESS